MNHFSYRDDRLWCEEVPVEAIAEQMHRFRESLGISYYTVSQRHGDQLAVAFCDVDGFKGINDRLGHEAGDTVLLAPAGASFDQFAGYGARGDAFADAARCAAGSV